MRPLTALLINQASQRRSSLEFLTGCLTVLAWANPTKPRDLQTLLRLRGCRLWPRSEPSGAAEKPGHNALGNGFHGRRIQRSRIGS